MNEATIIRASTEPAPSPTTSKGRAGVKARGKSRTGGPAVSGGSREARRIAAAVLEVLTGLRTPTDAAAALGLSVPRYYVLERRALEGLVRGCEPRAKGPGLQPQVELDRLRQELTRLQQESARHLALARTAQRVIALAPPQPAKPGGHPSEKVRRRRRPTVRALQVVRRLQSEPLSSNEPVTEAPGPGGTDRRS